jgi:hypothetical protein
MQKIQDGNSDQKNNVEHQREVFHEGSGLSGKPTGFTFESQIRIK